MARAQVIWGGVPMWVDLDKVTPEEIEQSQSLGLDTLLEDSMKLWEEEQKKKIEEKKKKKWWKRLWDD